MARHPVIGYLVWAALFGALFAWEGLALARVSGFPTHQRRVPRDHALSGGAVGAVRTVVVGGLALLRPRLALPAPGLTKAPAHRNGRLVLTSSLIRQDLVPMLTGYLLVMAALGIGLRRLYRPAARPGQAPGQAGEQPGRPRLHQVVHRLARADPACDRHRRRRIPSPDGRRDRLLLRRRARGRPVPRKRIHRCRAPGRDRGAGFRRRLMACRTTAPAEQEHNR